MTIGMMKNKYHKIHYKNFKNKKVKKGKNKKAVNYFLQNLVTNLISSKLKKLRL